MKRILTRVVPLAARANSCLKLDLMWRIGGCLSLRDRRNLLFRLLQGEAESLVFRCDGALWTVFPWDNDIAWSMFVDGIPHMPEIKALLPWMRKNGRITAARRVVIDIGANIGTSSIPIAQLEDCRVIALEPVPENFALLKENVRLNGLADRICCKQLAISDIQGKADMVLMHNRSGGAEVLHPIRRPSFDRNNPIRATIKTDTDTLVHLVQSCGISLDQISFIWSDTQGHEGNVIRSGAPLWQADIPLYVEIEPPLLQSQNCLELLCDHAWSFFILMWKTVRW